LLDRANGAAEASSFAVQFHDATAVKLVAPCKLSRKVLKLPVQSEAQDNSFHFRRQSNSDGTAVQICGQVCKNFVLGMKLEEVN